MAALVDLEKTPRSRPGGLTPPEASLVRSCWLSRVMPPGLVLRLLSYGRVKPGIDMMADPLDCVFKAASGGEIHSDSTSTSHRVHTRSHKRSHRRRRMRHQEASSGLSEGH